MLQHFVYYIVFFMNSMTIILFFNVHLHLERTYE